VAALELMPYAETLAAMQGLEAVHFAFRTDSDLAQLMVIRAGFGIGICQVALARRDRNLERVLPRLSSSCSAYGWRCMKISNRRRVAAPSSTDSRSACSRTSIEAICDISHRGRWA
jgi:hypothetical protein